MKISFIWTKEYSFIWKDEDAVEAFWTKEYSFIWNDEDAVEAFWNITQCRFVQAFRDIPSVQ